MRFMYFLACVIVAWDMAEKAAGASPSHIIKPEFAWVNWFPAALWLAYGLYAFVWRPE